MWSACGRRQDMAMSHIAVTPRRSRSSFVILHSSFCISHSPHFSPPHPPIRRYNTLAMPWGFGESSGAGGSAGSVYPFRAPVVPRACATPGGAALPLHERIKKLLDAGARGPVNVYGPGGSGKSVALAHVAA